MRLLHVSSIKYRVSVIAIYYLLLVTCNLLLVSGCKKDNKKNNPPPVISISLPAANQPFSYALDPTLKTYTTTINVSAQVSDNEHLASISVALVDGNYVQQQASVNVPISSADFIFNINYEVTKFNLASGTYYVQVTASDGANTTVAYQPIYIYTSPAQLWGYCVVLKSAPNAISYVDTSKNNLFTFPALSVGYNGMRYSGYNQQLYVNGNGNGTQQFFQAYSMQAQSLGAVSYTENSLSNDNFTCLYTDGNKPYVGYYNIYNASNPIVYSYLNGAISTSYGFPSTAPNGYPYYFTATSLYGIAAFKSKVPGTPDNLTTFNISGSFIKSVPFPSNFKAVAIFEKQQDSLYVLGNDTTTNTAALYIYQPVENQFSPSSLLSGGLGKLTSAVLFSNEFVIFSTNTGVYVCNGLNVISAPLISGGAQKLSFQPNINNKSILTVANSSATSANLSAYAVYTTTSSIAPLWTWNISDWALTFNGDSLIDFQVITNK
jgi:hypothetical protein